MSIKVWIINQLQIQLIMLKNILKLSGAQELSKNQQKSINGGRPPGCQGTDVTNCGTPPAGTIYRCIGGTCKLELLP